MGTWNYRVFHRVVQGEDEYSIREAYYDDDDNVNGFSDKAIWPHGESRKELGEDLIHMVEAMAQPTIEINEAGTDLV